MIFIYVLDVNEWSPEFQGTPYTASIKEVFLEYLYLS